MEAEKPTRQNILIASAFPGLFVFLFMPLASHSVLFVVDLVYSVVTWWLCVLFLVTLHGVKLIGTREVS